jgi:hypothetical protein
MTTVPHRYSPENALSQDYWVRTEGDELAVLHHPAADLVSFECNGPVEIESSDEPNLVARPAFDINFR